MSAQPWTWVEPFAGAAACALRLVAGDAMPPVAWMGGKRRLARAILDAMGVPPTPPTRVVLADAGPWGWVWPLLLEPQAGRTVAGILRAWAKEHPRALWQRLVKAAPFEDRHEAAAQWLWLQARSASGVPIWWDGWREGEKGRWEAMCGRGVPQKPGAKGDSRAPRDRGEDKRWPAHRAQAEAWQKGTPAGRPPQDAAHGQRGTWRASNGEGREVEAGQKGIGAWSQMDHDTGRSQPAGQSGRGWRMGEDPGKATRGDRTPAQQGGEDGSRWRVAPQPGLDVPCSQNGTARGATGGIMDPGTIAARIEALILAFEPVEWSMHHGDAADLLERLCLCESGPVWFYLDPPYQGATGYGWDMPRTALLELALRCYGQGACACVGISEAEPVAQGALETWARLDLTGELESAKAEWLTLSRPPLIVPVRQGGLFDKACEACTTPWRTTRWLFPGSGRHAWLCTGCASPLCEHCGLERATWLVGREDNIRVCDRCEPLPAFKRRRRRVRLDPSARATS